MRIAASILVLLCGIAVLAGIFLPWAEASGSILGFLKISYSVTGLNVLNASHWDSITRAALSDNIHAVLVLIGAVVMTVCSLPALILSALSKGGRSSVTAFNILISLAALVAIAGLAWFVVDMSSIRNWTDYIGYGVYVCGGGAVLGLIFGALASVK